MDSVQNGHMRSSSTTTPAPAPKPDGRPLHPAALPLLRPRQGRVLCGVCLAVSLHLGVPLWQVRLAFAVGTLFLGAGLLAYIFLWMFVPVGDPVQAQRHGSQSVPVSEQPLSHGNRSDGTQDQEDHYEQAAAPYENLLEALKRAPRPSLLALAGFILIAIAATMLVTGSSASTVFSVILALGGIGVAWLRFNADRGQLWSMLAGGLLLFTGYAVYVGDHFRGWESPLPAMLLGLLLLTGVGLVIVPWGNTLVRDLSSERVQKEREEERADIAAHLHDGVLQTLTLIQLHSTEPRTVSTLARQQERELRGWLYQERKPADRSVSTGIKEIAAAVEDEQGRPIEVVTVGDAEPSERTEALLAATRQALLNAVVHGGEPVSVYCEADQSSVQVFVRDHGEGFDMNAIDPSRLGIRESIIGRVRRRGGTVEIVSKARWGTEVRMTMPIDSNEEHNGHEGQNGHENGDRAGDGEKATDELKAQR